MGGVGGLEYLIIFTLNPNFKKKYFFYFGGWGECGARLSEFLLQQI